MKRVLWYILKAVAVLESEIGYCQGMNFVAAALLTETLCPETAFWSLLHLIRRSALAGIYTSGASMLHPRLLQVRELSKKHLPELSSLLASIGLDTDLIAHQCFLTLFAYYFHPSFLLRFYMAILSGEESTPVLLVMSVLKQVYRALLSSSSDSPLSAESVLKNLQEFRSNVSQLTLTDAEGISLFKEIYNSFTRDFQPVISLHDLNQISMNDIIRSLIVISLSPSLLMHLNRPLYLTLSYPTL